MSQQCTLILGYGVTGRALEEYLRRAGLPCYVWDDAQPDVSISWEEWNRLKTSCLRVVVSPGVHPSHPVLHSAQEAGIPIHTDIECFVMSHPKLRTVGVTGTNGKSTVTEALASALRSYGEAWDAVGNVGRSPWSLQPVGLGVVCEWSSFQLHYASDPAMDVGVILPIAVDHLDWHGSADHYVQAKLKLTQSKALVVHSSVRGFVKHHPSVLVYGSSGDVRCHEDAIVLPDGSVYPVDQEYYWRPADRENLGAVLAALYTMGYDVHKLERISFLAYRGQRRVYPDGWCVINDSKATNLHAVHHALESVRLAYPGRPVILMLGGIYKEPYEPPELHEGEQIVVFGALAASLGVGYDRCVDAVAAVQDRMRSGPPGIVLFAPGGSSFDEFSGYAHRGACFDEWMNTYA